MKLVVSIYCSLVRDSAVGVTTRYGPDGLGSQWGRDFLCWVIAGGKAAGIRRLPHTLI